MTDEDENLDFLYEDLEPQESRAEKELREKNEDLMEANASLLDQLQVLFTRHQERLEENRILSRNLSSLIKTARNEVNRKNATITDLKKKLDDLTFKRSDGQTAASSIVVDPKDLTPKLTIPPKMKPYKNGDLDCCPPVSDLFLDASKGFHRITCGNSSVSFVRHESMSEIKNRDIIYIRLDDGTFLGKKSLPSSNKDGGKRLILTPSEYKSLKRKRESEVSNSPSKKMKNEYSLSNEDRSKKGSSESSSCRNSAPSTRNEKCQDSKRNEKHINRYSKPSPEPKKREWKDKYANEADKHRSSRDRGYPDRKSRRENKEEKSRDSRNYQNKSQLSDQIKDSRSMDHDKKKEESSRENRNHHDKKLSNVTSSSDQIDSKQKRSVVNMDHRTKKDNVSSRDRRNQSGSKIKETVTLNSDKKKEYLTGNQIKTESNLSHSKTLSQIKKSSNDTESEKKVCDKPSNIQGTKGAKGLPSIRSSMTNSISLTKNESLKTSSIKTNHKCNSKNENSSIKVKNLDRLKKPNNEDEQKEVIKSADSKNSLYSLKRKKDSYRSKEMKNMDDDSEKKSSLPTTASKFYDEKLKNDSSETLKGRGKMCNGRETNDSLVKSDCNPKDSKKKALTVKRSNPKCNPKQPINHNSTLIKSSLKPDISSSELLTTKPNSNTCIAPVKDNQVFPPRISGSTNIPQASSKLKDNDKENVLSCSSDHNSLTQTSASNALLADLEMSDSDEEDALQALFHSEDANKPATNESSSSSPDLPCGDDKVRAISKNEKPPSQLANVEPNKEDVVLRNKRVSRKQLNAILFDGSDNDTKSDEGSPINKESKPQPVPEKNNSSSSDAAASHATTVSMDTSDLFHIPFQSSDVSFSKSLKRVNTEELENMVTSRHELMTRLIEEEKLCRDELSRVYMISPVKYFQDQVDSKEPGEISDSDDTTDEEEGKEEELVPVYSTPVSKMSATPRNNDVNFNSTAGIASILRDDLVRTAHISPSSGIISTPPSGAVGSTRKRNVIANESTPVRRSPRKHPTRTFPSSTSKGGKKTDSSDKKSSAFARTSRYLFGDEDEDEEEGGNRESKSNSKDLNKDSRSKYRQ